MLCHSKHEVCEEIWNVFVCFIEMQHAKIVHFSIICGVLRCFCNNRSHILVEPKISILALISKCADKFWYLFVLHRNFSFPQQFLLHENDCHSLTPHFSDIFATPRLPHFFLPHPLQFGILFLELFEMLCSFSRILWKK